jgi:NAD(P)H dehydrogenase (quinone)
LESAARAGSSARPPWQSSCAAAGKPFAFVALPEPVLRGGLEQAGLPAVVVGAILSIQEKFVEGGFDIVTGDVERLAGRPPHTVRDLLTGAFAGR